MSHLYRRPPKTGIYWLAFYKDNKLYRRSLKTKDRSTAIYGKSKIDQDVAEGKYITYDPNPDSDRILEEYEKATEHYKVAKTHKGDSASIKAFLSWAGIKTINQITEKKLQDYLNHRIKNDKLSLNSCNRHVSTIKAWLNFAARRKYIFFNPVKDFKKYRIPQNPPKFLTEDEIKKIMEAAKDARFYPAIFTALYTGMRRQEVFTLEWPDIDFDRDVITVKNKDGFLTKSKKFRTIPLHHKLKEFLLPLRKDSGQCFDETNFKHDFPRIIQKAGLKDIGFHHFRHTFASHLAISGVDLYTIAQILGHSSITVTQIYAHLTKDYIKGAVEKLSF